MKLLIDERPLVVQPSLVRLLGSIERAIVLQQIHLLSQQSEEADEQENRWTCGTQTEWCDEYFKMWKPPTLKKHLRWLRENGYLIVSQRSANPFDKTNHYRVNYAQITGSEN